MSILSLERIMGTRPALSVAWLDPQHPADRAFGECFNILNDRPINEKYKKYLTNIDPNRRDGAHYVMSGAMDDALHVAAESLHKCFLQVTESVIVSDNLLQRCGIPPEYWERLRNSWRTQPNTIAGRFDFLYDGKDGLFCVEYNADSASTILECGRLQQATAVALGIDKDTMSSGARLAPMVQEAWRASGVSGRVHFCIEDDGEEEYTAQFVMECAKAVGLEPRLCVMFDDFKFTEDGGIVDGEGVPVRFVWKTWMWESVITDDQKARAERGPDWRPSPSQRVRLCDVMFHPAVLYFEPFWKVIMSNKALLPLLYDANRGHPNILPASFTQTAELQSSGFAKKPIVGRIGENIQLVDASGEAVSESQGRFGAREVVYQKLVNNPPRGGYYATLGVWIVNGKYGGVSMREDENPITGPFSQYGVIRIQPQKQP